MRKNLINARKNKELTQEELAKKINITSRHYRALEAGTSNGTIPLWINLKYLLGMSIDDLLQESCDSKK